ncbi:uncharacterized protein L199_002033 [Kwoniella botswanensis]|uniref:uncharacterized protein n=1 Tax=Kwoniella botswanensis TaxID=1268659 RepID=UPI00315D13D7
MAGSSQLSKQDNQGDYNRSPTTATATDTDLINKLPSWGMPAYLATSPCTRQAILQTWMSRERARQGVQSSLPTTSAWDKLKFYSEELTDGEEEWESTSLSPWYARMFDEYIKALTHNHDHDFTKANVNANANLDLDEDQVEFKFGLIDERGLQMSREDPDISKSRKEAQKYWNECAQQGLVKGGFGSSMARGISALSDGTTVIGEGEGEGENDFDPEAKCDMEEYHKMRTGFKDWFLNNGNNRSTISE